MGTDDDGLDLRPMEPAAKPKQASLPIAAPKPAFGQALDAPKGRARSKAKASAAAPVDEDRVGDYRHPESTRTNIPEAGLATQDRTPTERVTYAYDPHLDPQLVWAGKAEHTSFEVDTVSLHIHERVSTAGILRAVRREDVQRTLFADPSFSVDQELDFYQHEMDWANRLILGDSLLVMNSLIRREGMAGSVQCIYIDPPYGVNYNSNFQPRTDQRDVKDGDDRSLTREPEQIRAYRDTWQLGIHSYLTYLRDRLLLARDLLTDSGSVFVQISDENVHRVRAVMDEVFGAQNFMGQITAQKTGGLGSVGLKAVADYLLWYAKSKPNAKYRQLLRSKQIGIGEGSGERYDQLEEPDGSRRPLSRIERDDPAAIPSGARPFQLTSLMSGAFRENTSVPYEFEGITYHPGLNNCWKTTTEGLDRLVAAKRVMRAGRTIRFVRYIDDFPAYEITNVWEDTAGSPEKIYVVQTSPKLIARCILMSTDPGDLVLDPTCGSGTTAFVAEQWGRRWITCDTSRVALALARQRLMTASYDYYQLADADRGVDGGFRYRTVPHVTLRSIAQNEPPETETLYDQPLKDSKRTRVSGPFTTEQIPSFGIDADAEETYDPGSLDADDRSDDLCRRGEVDPVRSIGELVDMLRIDGVRLPGGRKLDFLTLAPSADGGQIHAEGEFDEAGETRRIAVSFGPLHGPVSARQVEDVLRDVTMMPIHAVLFAGFAFDDSSISYLQNYRMPKNLQILRANIAADVLVPDLLKNRRGQQLFAVFGEPDVVVEGVGGGEFEVEVRGIDVYDPATGEVSQDTPDGIAAWFLDQDYDRRSFLISQAFSRAPVPAATRGSASPRRSRAGWTPISSSCCGARAHCRSGPVSSPGSRSR